MIKKNPKSGWCIIIYGYAGAGKTVISKKIKSKIEKKIGKCLLLDGEDLRNYYAKIGMKFGYRKIDRDKTVIPKLKLLNLLLKKGINIIHPTLWLNKFAIKKWSVGFENLIKIYIKTEIDDIITFGKKKKVYSLKKNVVGIDIKPFFPKSPQVIIKNDFKKSINQLSHEVIIKFEKLFSKS